MSGGIKAIITTLDNLPLLEVQVDVLRRDPLINEIVVVSNGSVDGTNEWLETQPDLTTVIRANNGAGPGRNAGLDAAGEFDYALMLDGGIRPLIGGTQRMLDYLNATPECDVIGVEIPDFETDIDKAWRRWVNPILPQHTYQNTCLSHTAYCLSHAICWDGLRFSEDGPFGEPGWGVDDDELACQWAHEGIIVHVVTGVHPYRRASGSFRRLFLETGIWPNQYGSTYEKRLVWMQQNWPQYGKGIQWGEPWLTVMITVNRDTILENAIALVKATHDNMRKWHFDGNWKHIPQPYSIIAWNQGDPEFDSWAEPRRLRQHHGTTIVLDGKVLHRNAKNEATWTGDFRVWRGDDIEDALRLNAHYWAAIETADDLGKLLALWGELQPQEYTNIAPRTIREKLEV